MDFLTVFVYTIFCLGILTIAIWIYKFLKFILIKAKIGLFREFRSYKFGTESMVDMSNYIDSLKRDLLYYKESQKDQISTAIKRISVLEESQKVKDDPKQEAEKPRRRPA